VSLSSRKPGEDRRLAMLERMLLIRRIEERLGEDFRAGRLISGVHLYIGQEAVAVGVCEHLKQSDWIASTHRGHGHFLAKGGDPMALMAEVHGRRTGACKGMGGTMHVADLSRGILGANGIVGGGISLIAGAALAAHLDGRSAVAVAFFGDGATAQGVLAEALNLSALWKLPMVMVCENNGWSEYSPTSTVVAGAIAERARPFGVPAVTIDGNDLEAVWEAAGEAIARARGGQGPTLIEARTYRLAGHVEAETGFLQGASYRSAGEIEEWRARDPIARYAAMLVAAGVVDDASYGALDTRVLATVEGAVRFALESPEPDPAQALRFMFSDRAP
jgi:acetoin:2,6-dichlorophenolindophenol oxidoreductase subunit alpha